MADTHEEQLLSHWLRDIARQDESLRTDHLEARVMSAVRGRVRLKPDTTYDRTTYYMKAAALAIFVLVPGMLWMRVAPPVDTVRRPASTTTVVIPERSEEPSANLRAHAPVGRRPTSTRPTHPTIPTIPTILTIPTTPTIPTPPTDPTNLPHEFVPLMPMTPQELTGPFQIVRVQMPRSSLGALRSPLDHPSELVEADVLLGEDGMARAIRVSTGGSIYPWRSR